MGSIEQMREKNSISPLGSVCDIRVFFHPMFHYIRYAALFNQQTKLPML